METEELTIGRVHHGRNIRRTRIEKDMNQEGLSELVHLSQPAVSKYFLKLRAGTEHAIETLD